MTIHATPFVSTPFPLRPPMLDKDVAELTWENGQLAMHGLGPPRLLPKPLNSTTWAGGTLESIVNQATCFPYRKPSVDGGAADELVPWLDYHRGAGAASSATMTVDALVPCSNKSNDRTTHEMESMLGLGVVGCSTRMGSCSGTVNTQDGEVEVVLLAVKRARVAVAPEWSSKELSGSATFGRDSQHVSVDTYEKEFGVGFTSISHGSPENTTKPTSADDHLSVSHSKTQENGKSTKRSRAAAIHNQSERTDKASMLDEVIEYLKQLQAQVHMMSRMNLPPAMLPMAMQQQLQMLIMSQMRMGMGMNMGMDMNNIGRPNIIGIPPVLPNPFMSMGSWDGSNDRLQPASATVVPDPVSTFLACQSQPMTMDAYSRMATMYQQMQQPPASTSKS